jgi:hypothetical protein
MTSSYTYDQINSVPAGKFQVPAGYEVVEHTQGSLPFSGPGGLAPGSR